MKNREYNKLFLGANEDQGKDRVSLTYSVSSKQFVFYTDVDNTFKYPEYATTMDLSATSLINDGAFGGTYPAVADRITYSTDCIPIGINTMKDSFGVYLGTWLYKPELDSDIGIQWTDRWYNPGYISEKEALLEPYGSGHTAIKDEPTRFVLESGVSYDYFHFGNYNNQLILSGIDDATLVTHFEDWNEDSLIQENGTIKSDRNLIVNRDIPLIEQPQNDTIDANDLNIRVTNKVQDDYILDITAPSSYAAVSYSSDIMSTGDISTSIWMKSDDWYSGDHNHLVSNGFRSGWNIKLNNGFYNPLVVYVSNNNAKIVIYDVEGKLLYSYDLSHTIENITSYTMDEEEMYLYILGKQNTPSAYYIYKVDITTGLIINQTIALTLTENKKIYFDADGVLTLFYKQGLTYGKVPLNKSTLVFGAPVPVIFPTSYTYYDIDLQNAVSGSNYKFDFDNYNNKWEIRTDGIYRDSDKIYSVSASHIKCSHDDKLWVIVNPALSSDYYTLNVYDISRIDTIISNPFLSFLLTLETTQTLDIGYPTSSTMILFDLVYVKNETQGYIVNLDQNLMYKMNQSKELDVVNFYNLSNITDFNLSNNTSYARNRKFNYIKNNRISQLELKIVTEEPISGDLTTHVLSCSADNLVNKEWHHFAFTVNQTSSAIDLYLDTKLVASTTYNGDDIYYVFETPLTIGTGSGRITLLSKELKNDTYDYFVGSVDDFRLYNKVLTQSDIERIYTNKFRYKDLIYNLELPDNLYFVEEIDRFFKFSLPGSKAPYYNIKIHGINVDDNTKILIETIIKNSIKYVAPAYTELYKIIWVE